MTQKEFDLKINNLERIDTDELPWNGDWEDQKTIIAQAICHNEYLDCLKIKKELEEHGYQVKMDKYSNTIQVFDDEKIIKIGKSTEMYFWTKWTLYREM